MNPHRPYPSPAITLLAAAVLLATPPPVFAQQTLPAAPTPRTAPTTIPSAQTTIPAAATPAAAAAPTIALTLPHSRNPFDAYRAAHIPLPNLANSARLDSLIHNGVLELSLNDAIALALENNLDLAIARYNIPIAEADVLRTEAGGTFRGVNAGVVQNTPGGGVGGFGSGAVGAGAGGTSGGAGGAGSGASGLVQSTLGTGTAVSSYDPAITGSFDYQHSTTPLSNITQYGVQTLRADAVAGNIGYAQAFATGTSLSVTYNASRQVLNSPFTFLNPQLNSAFQIQAQQQLLAGFGLGPNLRFLRIARNNRRISDEAFEAQVIATISQIATIYWDFAAAFGDEQVKQGSLDFANQTLDTARKELALQAIPALDVTKDEAEVAAREEDLTIAKSQLQFQELLIKNAITKNLDDPILEAMPVRPTDLAALNAGAIDQQPAATEDLVQLALSRRLDLAESVIDLQNRDISNAAARNALLPTLSLIGSYGGSGLAGPANASAGVSSTSPTAFSGAFDNSFNNSAPNYYVGVQVNVPIRNRVAKSDQIRSELEARQSELHQQQLRKQIRIEVRNAQYALVQSEARVTAAVKARDLAQKTFDITGKEQALGAGSALQTLGARHDLATAESALVAARTAYQKARVELDFVTGSTLEANAISIDAARNGSAAAPATAKP